MQFWQDEICFIWVVVNDFNFCSFVRLSLVDPYFHRALSWSWMSEEVFTMDRDAVVSDFSSDIGGALLLALPHEENQHL